MAARTAGFAIVLLSAFTAAALAQKGGAVGHAAPPVALEASVLTSMPVKELAIFKDGHAFVLHESELPTDGTGDVVLDTLPTPVIGTFWAYSADPAAKLAAVVAGQRPVKSERTALNIRELLDANPGAEVIITEEDGRSYGATVLGIPKPGPVAEAPAPGATPAGPTPAPPAPNAGQPGTIVLLQMQEGVKALPLERIREVTFRTIARRALPVEESRRLLTLKLAWDGQPGPRARVGMVYLQNGVRWIPSYRVDIDGAGQARIRLQATLVNELADLNDVTASLVIGVPSFQFEDQIDPIALQAAAARLAPELPQVQRLRYAFDNAIQTQVAQPGWYEPASGSPVDADETDYAQGSRHEDLFVFRVEHLTLRKGERMVVSVAEFTLPYEDVFVLDMPFAPPPEIERNCSHEQLRELARLMRAPQVRHRLRLQNSGPYPLTTAPAIILREGQLLAQSLMTYTARGGRSDLDLTTAVDVPVSKSEVETKRAPDAMKWNGETYGRADLAGTIRLTNRRAQPVRLEVTRHLLGAADTADHDGRIEAANALEDSRGYTGGEYPGWWYWYNWPYWWHRFNGVGRVTWQFTLEPEKDIELHYTWHYYWR